MTEVKIRKMQLGFVAVLLFLYVFFGRTDRFDAASRYYSKEQMQKKYGTYYMISSISKIKVSGGKVSITGTLQNKNYKLLKHKKRTYKLAKNMKKFYIEGDWPWEYEGKHPRSEFIKYLKWYKKSHFPGIHFWVKKGKITAFGLSS